MARPKVCAVILHITAQRDVSLDTTSEHFDTFSDEHLDTCPPSVFTANEQIAASRSHPIAEGAVGRLREQVDTWRARRQRTEV